MLSYLRGYYVIIVEGVGIERFINELRKNGVCIYNMTRIKSTSVEFSIDRCDFKKLKGVYRRGNYDIKVKQKTGIPFFVKRIYKHKLMWVGAVICFLLLMATSQFVTDVYIQAPEGIKKDELRKEFNKAGVRPGVFKKSIDRKIVRDYIMSKFDNVAYVSINVKGTNIFVTVTKKAESLKSTKESNYCNIIAKKDGIIERVIPRSGKALVHKEDIVQKGDVLLSGANNRSIPEVWARTFYESKKTSNFIDTKKVITGKKKKVRTFVFYNHRFTFRKKIKYKDYTVKNSESKFTIGNYTFPFKIKTSVFYETKKVKVRKSEKEIKDELSKKALKDLEYIIPISARIEDVKHKFKIEKSVLEYLVTVETSENIAKVYPLTNAEAEKFINDENKREEGQENQDQIPSNPEKRPLNDIRNKFKNKDNTKDSEDNLEKEKSNN